MHIRKLILLVLASIIVFLITTVSSFYLLMGNSNLIVPEIFLVFYFIYILKITYDEYIDCRLDKTGGSETRLLKFIESSQGGYYSRKNKNGFTYLILTFYDNKTDETLKFTGDFSNFSLEVGKKYYVSFYKHSKTVIDINEAIFITPKTIK